MSNIRRTQSKLNTEEFDGLMITGAWNRRYLSGFTGSNGVLLITKNEKILITDYRYVEQAKIQTDFDVILHAEHTGHKDKIFTEVAKQVNALGINRLGFEQQHLNYGAYCKVKELMHTELIPTFDLIEDLRMIKSEAELTKLKTASHITDQAYLHILEYIHPGMTEMDVSEELQSFIKKNGGTTTGFPPIVASGVRSSMPHGRASDKKIEKGEMITIDFGANYQSYWADISRTVSLGEPDSKIKEIQEIVLKSFKNCVRNIKAGISDQDVDWLMRKHLMKTGYNEQSGTGTGHGIGLEVHEKPLFSVMKEKELKAGMTVTVEPGIYIPDLGGARVEDVLLITEGGCEVLTPSTKELVII
ncbi:aminopeptidase P family protein [Lentibacillus cibarius]|uniref:Aminopeptidase P family protein n=1 Tax=Lentibacillus cibarius TaxID=2583219 RepID=A0A549YEK7_9BACI|nr:Xaa-Pro peptidase family protein [Lentibacillus cibarius]TMN21443.1 aminopeptidase P family protein [Lentibacillus cibarius]TRM10321.1 aminopeptidase P family protein [Lentibacillus cibarius]